MSHRKQEVLYEGEELMDGNFAGDQIGEKTEEKSLDEGARSANMNIMTLGLKSKFI